MAPVRRLAKGAAISRAQTVVDREDHESTARQILIGGIHVVVCVHRMEAEQHLPERSPVREDEAGAARRVMRRHEQLAVDLRPIEGS